MSRRICIVTGTRAEYGLLKRLMGLIQATDGLTLQIIATGSHLSPQFGLTYQEIEADGFTIDRKVDLQLGDDTAMGVAVSMGIALRGLVDAYAALKPDMVLVLGDRYEIFAAATAAMLSRIPIAHLHGGELTEGAMDEAMRHAITKMAHLHFVAAEPYRARVIQLGEQPENVHLVGGLGVDAIAHTKLMSKQELEQSLDFKLGAKNLLVTFHPVTLEDTSAAQQMAALLAALDRQRDTHIIFTMPNADPGSRALFDLINDFVASHPSARVYTSLGAQRYLSTIPFMDAVVGNSSSGLIEVPSFQIPTINIGDRQRGRLKAASVIDCAPATDAILDALTQAQSPAFRATLQALKNPYGNGGAAEKIVQQLASQPLEGLLKKRFYDLKTVH